MGTHHLPVATGRNASRALDAALLLRPLGRNKLSNMAKLNQMLGQLEPPL
ncbi:MAG: hypothetical protein NTX33_05065 [Propionibacteriales bacterium]|nr:hypothetical protein [Propionibacteriales bacterium]